MRVISHWLVSVLVAALALAACSGEPHQKGPVVLAASSLHEALEQAADVWAEKGHDRPVLSFAGSSALARQLQNGAPADLYISADADWMDAIESEGLLRPGTRQDLLTNRIVLIASKDGRESLTLSRPSLSAALDGGYLAMADPDVVPAGKYGKAALEHLGLWDEVEGRIVRAENVRAALALVENGEAPLGIVYATDAAASNAVRIVATFPAGSYPPVRYPVAVLAASDNPDAEDFARFLASNEGQAIFASHGFGPAP